MKKQNKLTIALFALVVLFNACETYEMDEPAHLVPKTVDEDPLLPRINVNGTDLHSETFGDINNPIIIFLHGGPGSDYRAMISQIDAENASRYPDERNITNGGLSQLQNEYFCVFYDQRGAGLSPRFDVGEITFDLYLEDLDAIIEYYLDKKAEEIGISDGQVYLVSWSYGGTLGTGYINRYPEKVKAHVSYEPGPFSKEVYVYFTENTTSVFAQIGEEWVEEFLLSQDHFTPDDHERADYQYLQGAFKQYPEFHENVDCPLWRFGTLLGDDLEIEDRDNTSNLSSFKGKFLFIGGELTVDEYPEYAGTQMSYYPNSEFAEVSGVGHTGPWEKPAEISELIRNYLK